MLQPHQGLSATASSNCCHTSKRKLEVVSTPAWSLNSIEFSRVGHAQKDRANPPPTTPATHAGVLLPKCRRLASHHSSSTNTPSTPVRDSVAARPMPKRIKIKPDAMPPNFLDSYRRTRLATPITSKVAR